MAQSPRVFALDPWDVVVNVGWGGKGYAMLESFFFIQYNLGEAQASPTFFQTASSAFNQFTGFATSLLVGDVEPTAPLGSLPNAEYRGNNPYWGLESYLEDNSESGPPVTFDLVHVGEYVVTSACGLIISYQRPGGPAGPGSITVPMIIDDSLDPFEQASSGPPPVVGSQLAVSLAEEAALGTCSEQRGAVPWLRTPISVESVSSPSSLSVNKIFRNTIIFNLGKIRRMLLEGDPAAVPILEVLTQSSGPPDVASEATGSYDMLLHVWDKRTRGFAKDPSDDDRIKGVDSNGDFLTSNFISRGGILPVGAVVTDTFSLNLNTLEMSANGSDVPHP